jgi:hypothetical protein
MFFLTLNKEWTVNTICGYGVLLFSGAVIPADRYHQRKPWEELAMATVLSRPPSTPTEPLHYPH